MPKENTLYSESIPVIYKLYKKLITDTSTIKENVLDIDADNTRNFNSPNAAIRFQLKDSVNLLNLSSDNSGIEIKAKFLTKWKPVAARGAGDPFVDNCTNTEGNITLANHFLEIYLIQQN